MSISIEALKEKARRHEQDEEWRLALDLYLRTIRRLEEEERPDIGLHNRVGDIFTRVGDRDQAVEHYETAVDLYEEAGLANNAIAVCKKIVRNVPERHRVFLRMGLIRARQGFVVDARHHFLTYAERMKAAGDLDEAMRALVEFAGLVPDDADTRLAIASQFEQHDRRSDAVEQLGLAYQVLVRNGDEEKAREVGERLTELEPGVDLDELARGAERDAPLEASSFSPEELGGEPVSVVPTIDDDDAAELDGLDGFDIDVAGDDDDEESAPDPDDPDDPDDHDDHDAAAAADSMADEVRPALAGEEEGEDFEVGSSLPYLAFGEDDEDDPGDDIDGPAELPFLEGTEALTPPVEPAGPMPIEAELEAASAWSDPEVDADDGPEAAPEAAIEEAVEESRAEGIVEHDDSPEGDVARHQREVEEAFRSGSEERLVAAYAGLAAALEGAGAADRARGVYQQVLEIDPQHTRARDALARIGGGDAGAAPEVTSSEDYVDLGAMILGDDAEKSTRFVVAYEEPSGDEDADFARMLTQFKSKVEQNVDSSDVKAHHDLGVAYREMGLVDEAIEQFQKALRASGSHLATYEALGEAFLDKEAWTPAIRVLTRALDAPWEVEDELLGIYYYLGRAYEAQGNTAQAVEFYDRVFSLDINFADVTERLRDLR